MTLLAGQAAGGNARVSYLNLSHYGVIGNHQSVAIVSRFGSIDWCCLPDLDSPSHFGALLDDTQGGRFSIAPTGEFHSEQHYLQRTLVLETLFETPFGRAVVTDWMPHPAEGAFGHPLPLICRRIEVVAGRIQWLMSCSPRFDYGSRFPRAELRRGGVLFRGTATDEIAQLVIEDQARLPLTISENGTSVESRFTLEAGESLQIGWLWGRLPAPQELPPVEDTIEFWRQHAHRCEPGGCKFAGPWHDSVARSALLLKLLSNISFGSLAAAATTSLPGRASPRTWDYRFAFVRENAEVAPLFFDLGNREDSVRAFRWLVDILMRDPAEELQPVYSIDGGRALPERELAYLSGYQDNRPVRIGNGSAKAVELDIYGRLIVAADEYYTRYDFMPPRVWEKLSSIADHVCQAWRRPDHGIWSCRASSRHYVSSKVYCWLALDRAIRLATRLGQQVPHRWSEEREILHRTICEQGFDSRAKSFVRAFGSRELDSSALLIAVTDFLPPEDPRVAGTIDAIQSQLCDGVLVHRYHGEDGAPGNDGPHLPSSFLLTAALARIGRVEDAIDRLAELCAYATPLGLLGEQVNDRTGETSGNFPYASSHISLIQASLAVNAARKAQPRAGLVFKEPEPAPARPKFSLKNLGKLRYR